MQILEIQVFTKATLALTFNSNNNPNHLQIYTRSIWTISHQQG